MEYTRTFRAGEATFWEQYEYFSGLDTYVISDLSEFIKFGNREHLSTYRECFEKDSFSLPDYRAANDHGKRRLKEDWPAIWKAFDLDNVHSS
jgi:hypothetical protein